MFLPASSEEVRSRGWPAVDVLLVTGDGYVDHPAFGIALIGQWLSAHGFRVAVLAQPRHDGPQDFLRFRRPRLFAGISAGNLDSVVANYSGNARVRDRDDYSPGGDPYFPGAASRGNRRRPDRATIRYSQLARAAWPGLPIVLGGLEASLRRFVHYDFQQERLRSSVLADAKADLLVYGMGERAVLAVAQRLAAGLDLTGIPGTCERLTDREQRERPYPVPPLVLPSWEEIAADPGRFLDAEKAVDRQARAGDDQPLLQRQQAVWILQHPASPPLGPEELDALYGLPYSRVSHPGAGDVPAFRMIRHSVTIVRGCCGNCSFCAIARHQGPVVTSRSLASVLAEVEAICRQPDFSGTITDLGGPTANLYGTSCRRPGPCRRRDCLYPRICSHLAIDEERVLALLDAVSRRAGVKHLFVSSGLRMELLLRTPRLLARILEQHLPGALKIAPEHTEPEVLRLMHKPGAEVLEAFLATCRRLNGGRLPPLTPYLIASHPGCTQAHMEALATRLRGLGLAPRQFQDFTPTPGTIATAMYVSGRGRDRGQPIHVARRRAERQAQRAVLEALRPCPGRAGP
ncbi:MAG: YgiQ family radical SAM protein [Thermodesulfobacteriota bacterium]